MKKIKVSIFLLMIILSLCLISCGGKGEEAPDPNQVIMREEELFPIGEESYEAADITSLWEWRIIMVVEEEDAGVLDTMRRSLGHEPKESESITVVEVIEVLHNGEVHVYDWTALLELNPTVNPGDKICLTYVMGCLGEIPEENVHIHYWGASE